MVLRMLVSICEKEKESNAMPMDILFWFLMILWLIFGAWGYRVPEQPLVRGGWSLLAFALLAILGWHAFGPPIK